jgi:hypothetical protein
VNVHPTAMISFCVVLPSALGVESVVFAFMMRRQLECRQWELVM